MKTSPRSESSILRALAKTFLAAWLSVCPPAAFAQPPPCGGDTVDRCWTGAVSGLWSNPNNWTPVGVPQNGELLRFHNDHNISMVNDLPNLAVRALWFFDFDYVLTGNAITFAGNGAPQPYFSGIVNFGGEDSHLTTLHCPIILGADASFESGGLAGSPIRLDLNGEINLNGHTLYLRSDPDDGRIEVSSVISGQGDVVVEAESPSTIEFNGQGNTFRGTLEVVSGRGFISFNKTSGVVVNDALLIRGLNDLAVVRLSRPEQIGDGATVTLEGEGRLFMQGHNETIGHLVLTNPPLAIATVPAVMDTEAATLTVIGNVTSWNFSPGSDEPAIKGRLSLPAGNHTFDVGGSHFYGLDVLAEITGPGGFTKTGDSALLLRANNTFAGNVAVSEGIIEARHALAFGTAAGGVTLSGSGSLTLDNVRINSETLFVRGTRSVTANTDGSLLHGVGNLPGWMGRIELDTNLVVLSDDLCVLGGPVVGPGGFEFLGQQNVLSGSGVSSAPSTYTGTVRVLCDLLTVFGDRAFRGPLIVGGGFGSLCEVRWGNSTRNSGVPEVTVHPNGLVNLDGRGETFTRLIMHGGRVATGTGFVSVARIITNPTNVTATVEGTLVLASTPTTEFTVADGLATPDLAISAVITDGFNNTGVVKAGDGELRLSGANDYGGTTRIDAGVVHIQNNTSLGTPGVGTTVRDGATLQIEFVGALAEPLNISGAGRGGTLGALNLMAATGVGASVVLAGPATVRVDQQFGILSGVISGTGPFTKIGAGALQFGGGAGAANTYTGDTLVEAGELVLAKGDNVTTVPGHLTIGGAGGFLGSPARVRHFAGNTIGGSVTVGRSGLWDINGFFESFAPLLLEGRPALTLSGGGDVQTGAGSLLLPAGDVVVAPGTIPNSSSIAGNVTLLAGSHRFVVGRGVSGIGLDVTEFEVPALVDEQRLNPAAIIKDGSGTMRLGGSNSFTGRITVNAGGLAAAHPRALGGVVEGTFVNGDASLALEGGFEMLGETLTLNSANAAALLSLGPVTNTWSGPIVLQRAAGIRVPDARGAFTHFGGVGTFDAVGISGPGGFTKSGPGTMFISGLIGGNSYTGPTTVNEGSLEALRTGRNLSSDIVVSGATAVLRTGRPGSIFTGARTVLPIGANMTVQNGASWAMNGTNFETLSRLVGDGLLTVSTAGALTVSNDVSCEFSGQVSGSGALNKRGPATLRFTGNSPGYTGLATVFDGTYKVDAQFLNSPITVKVGALLRGSGDAGDVIIENGGVVKVDSDGSGRLGGQFTMRSANFHNGSVLGLAFYGPHATGGNDQLGVANTVTLTSPTLSSGFNYPPREGDVITLINLNAAVAVNGAISGLPEGALRMIGDIPVVTSYTGGDGNDVTLTVTNLPLRGGGAQLVAGLGGSALVPDDCSQLWLAVTNRGAVALTGLRGQLRSLTPGVVVTMAESAYPDLAPNARGSNATPFQVRTEPGFPCGGGAEFELVLTAANFPPTAIAYPMPGASGFGLTLDGRDDQVEVSRTTFSSVVNNFTIELWAKPAGNRSETAETNAGVSGISAPLRQLQRFAVFPDRGNLAYGVTHVSAGLSIGRNGISVYEHGTNQVQASIHLPSRLVYSNSLAGWTHVALVYANRRPQLYVNGTLVRSSSAPSLFPNVHPSGSLGGSSQADFGNFQGQLDEVRIWNVALNPTQIQSNMSRSLTGAEPNLVTYFRCDEGNGSLLTDSAPTSPNPTGTLTDGAAFVFPGVVPFGDANCNGGGACESCLVVSGQFDTNALESVRRLTATGLPSVCDPPKPCPGFGEFPDAPVRHVLHHFTNSTAAEVCVTAQLRLGCPNPFAGAFGVTAYAGEFRINQPCSFYLGDDGAAEAPPPPFSFRVPPRTNFVLVVTARDTNLVCASYTLEVFGLPCPPPTLHIAQDATPDKVRLHWSSAYPEYRLQAVNSFGGPGPHSFGNVSTPSVLVGGKFAVTNAATDSRQFFRLTK